MTGGVTLKQISAFLRMAGGGSSFPIDSDEAAYHEHQNLLDITMPINGGKLQADGSWLQESWKKIDPPWPQSLPTLASDAGQQYIPVMSNDAASTLIVLDSQTLQQTAADGLVTLATKSRFDSPWDGAMFGIEGIPLAYKDKLSDFFQLLSYKLRSEDISVNVWVRARTGDTGPDYDDAYSHDFAVLAQIADVVELGCYSYWNPQPRSIAPHWWVEASIQYALSKGIPAQRIRLCLASFCDYWPITGLNAVHEITHSQAIQLIQDANSFVQWIESNENGLVREKYADVGRGHIWLHDGDTMRHSLDLVDEYGLRGISLFTPEFGSNSTWDTIAGWKRPAPEPTRQKWEKTAQRLHGSGGIFSPVNRGIS